MVGTDLGALPLQSSWICPHDLSHLCRSSDCGDCGVFAFWAWWRLDKTILWLVPGVLSLIIFAWLLTLTETNAAGRAFAAYGSIYISASLVWLRAAEGVRPDRFDVAGAAICL